MNDPLVGRTLGDFRIERFISKGSAGRVYEATQVTLNRRVALKVLEEGIFTPQDFRIRFQREAEYLARLEHPNVVPIYAAGTDGKYTFYAMRFVEGRTLDHLMGEGLAVRDGLRYLADIAGALAYIHENEIIHRDLKPSNIMVSDDSAMLTDFGIARFMQTTTITDTGTLLGTPLYMSPEQARREKATAASDLYAVGVIAYELCACRHPFMDRRREPDQARDTIFKRIAEGLCESPRAWIPEIPGRLEAILLESMALEPEARPSGAAALRVLLQEAAAMAGLDRLDAARERALGIRVSTEPGPARPRILVAEPKPAPADGTAFGNFTLQQEIGRGGMGVVYRAVQRDLDRVVALKLLPFASDGEGVERFRREAAAAAKLRHPNIVTVHEGGRVEDRHYYAMEFIEGESLEKHLERERQPVRRAMEIVRDVARAIRYAHEQGVIHRDLKPGNVLIEPSGRALITDFGLAKLTGSRSLTATGAVMGTPAYMAPEQAQGRPVDARTDVYGIGALLYHLLTGIKPFPDRDPIEMLVDVTAADPTPPRALNPKVHPDAETICLRAMEKEPARRYLSAAEMLDDVERFLDGEPIRARPVGRLSRAWRRVRRRPAAMAAIGAVLVVAVAAAVALVVQSVRYAAERDAIEHVRWAESNFRAGNLDEADRRAAMALDHVADFGPAHFWRGRVALRRYQEHRRLPAVWRTYGEISFSPLPPESPNAAALRDTVRAHFGAGGLDGWERSFADGTLALFDGRPAAEQLDGVLSGYALEWEPYLMAGLAHFYARAFDRALATARAGRDRWKGELPLVELEARALLALAHEGLLRGVDPTPRADEVVTLCVLGRIQAADDPRWPALSAQAHLLAAEYAESTGGDPDPRLRAALDDIGDPRDAAGLVVKADAILQRALSRHRRGRVPPDDRADFDASIAALDAAVEAAPGDAVPYFKRAEARCRLAEFLSRRETVDEEIPRIRDDYTRALQRSPDFIDAQLGAALAVAFEGELVARTPDELLSALDRSIAAAARLVESRPGYARARLVEATARLTLAQRSDSFGRDPTPTLEAAAAVMDEAVRTHPTNADVLVCRGRVHSALLRQALRDGIDDEPRRETALRDFEAATAVNPTSGEAYQGAAMVWFNTAVHRLFRGGEAAAALDAADEWYRRALEINALDAQAIAGRGSVELNRYNLAARDRTSDPLVHLSAAAGLLDRALQLHPYLHDAQYARLKTLQASIRISLDREQDARADAERGLTLSERYLKSDRRNPEAHLMRGIVCALRAEVADAAGEDVTPWATEALTVFDGAIRINGDYVEAYLERAQLLALLHRWQEAIDDLERARTLDPGVTAATEELMRHCRRQLGGNEEF